MNKKAQSISINTIIIAAIALIVLVVLIAIFTGRITLFGKGLDDALAGKECKDVTEKVGSQTMVGGWQTSCDEGFKQVVGTFSDAKDNPGKVCCISTG